MRYQNLEQEDTVWSKIKRSSYLIVSISLLTHAFSLVYSLFTYQKSSAAFISIIVSAPICFLVSNSHLTIYGVSVLGTLYLTMIQPYYSTFQIFYIVALSGAFMLAFWKPIHAIGSIFHCLPGRIHASLVFGIVLIVLSRFFPLAIQNIEAFFLMSQQEATSNPFNVLNLLFLNFNVVTLTITIVLLFLMFFLRQKLQKIPLIGILALLGILANMQHTFKSYSDICSRQGIDCTFYVVDPRNLKQPLLSQLIEVIPASLVMAIVILFEQFLYLEEFERRGKKYRNQGTLGEVTTQTKVLAIANIVSGALGGLPICINIFGTYQNFAFNKQYGFKGTKWVGLMQIPFSFLLYTFINKIFMNIPLFVLFIIVATPVIYFIRNVLLYQWTNLPTILFIAVISVCTHPIIALIFACFFSIYQISELLKPAPAQMMIEGEQELDQFGRVSRKTSKQAVEVEKNPDKETKHINEFENRIVSIDEDVPQEYRNIPYIIYRMIGSISFMNFHDHLKSINMAIDRHCRDDRHLPFLLSLRYSQIIDDQSITEVAYLAQHLQQQDIKIIFTGLHGKVIGQMQNINYFSQLLKQQSQEKRMFKIRLQ